ncbi:MAG: serine/threonine-protein phosphatase [Bacteroides sp.]|nr:serine/threonine-protein phosphatase [Bacteroides sp.]
MGEKSNQEDSLFPAIADTQTRVFILCDGMGGHDYGEVASQTVCYSLGTYLSSCSSVDIPTFDTGLSKAYDALDSLDCDTDKTPGTTMTCLCINPDNFLVSHIGDSRIYHIRPSLFNAKTKRGGILYQSSDHSLVNDLLKAGEITPEEARDFPRKNVITRAMQPYLDRRFAADTYVFDNVASGDYFFLCSDGVMEHLFTDTLCEILASTTLNDIEKLRAIKIICQTGTRDNYSCWLIPVDRVQIINRLPTSSTILASEAGISEPKIPRRKKIAKAINSFFTNSEAWQIISFYIWIFLSIILVVFLLYIFLKLIPNYEPWPQR